MELYLIRHGETVDNVAGLYAGVRDSALTNHGTDQARRLGEYFANHVKLTHIFSSPLSRALKTAEAVRKAQSGLNLHDAAATAQSLDIVKVPDLIEQNFGYYEGKPFYARSDPKKTGRQVHYDTHKDDPGFVDVESKESISRRADCFLDVHLLPLFEETAIGNPLVVVVVSHGILLSTLWRRLLLRLPRKSLTIAPHVTAARGNIVVEHLGGWSNTGYLHLSLSNDTVMPGSPSALSSPLQAPGVAALEPAPTGAGEAVLLVSATVSRADRLPESLEAVPRLLPEWPTTIVAIDCKQHLNGLKRQRGGIGRLAYDEGQKRLDSFFKRERTG
ncbi:hypothetical protein LTR08_000385 [Meristemomyces frigidus]|nr:hypothetical protein LTR08_000385 [Meristemomyces frigidus]